MSDHIDNAGKKGRWILYFFTFIILFISTWAWVYYSNQNGLN